MTLSPQAGLHRDVQLRLKDGREKLAQQFIEHPRPRTYLHQHARLVDQALIALSREILPVQMAVIAVGGFGRGELYPASDVDVLLLTSTEPGSQDKTALEDWVQACWDAGLEIGHSVRTVSACLAEAANDISVETSLLESRLLWGNPSLYNSFTQAFHAHFNASTFVNAKLFEARARHARFEDSAYKLEPNIKESPGGLRDIHVIMWLARAAGLEASWKGLAKAGLITSTEARRISDKEKVLALLRIHLHLLARRREDRLAFDFQAEVAARIGLGSDSERRASEQLMQRYYRAAHQVLLIKEILAPALKQFVSPIKQAAKPIDGEFEQRGRIIGMRDPHLFEQEPTAIFRAFLVAMKHSIRLFDAATLRALWRARTRIDSRFRASKINQNEFMEILRQPHGITWALHAMNRYGILGRYIPAFGRIAGQMQHDLFHVYTVDEHILTVLRNVRRFSVTEFAHEYPLASRLIAGFDKPDLLYLAALFHDIAKGRGGDHSELGSADARLFCRGQGLSKDDGELVAWLVKEHLSMSRTAQKEDLSDPDVIAAFAGKVETPRRLAALYILTVADIRGTSPRVWNAWKGKLLEDLYTATLASLSGKQDMSSYQARQEEARAKLALYGIQPNAVDGLWLTLNESYFLRFDTQDIAWHARMLWQKMGTGETIVRARLSPVGAGIQVLVYCPDQSDLFERICGFFARNQFSVVEAKIHTTLNGYALDSFQVLDDAKRDVHYRDFLQFVEYELGQALNPCIAPTPVPLARQSRRLKHFPIQPIVEIRPDERGRYYVLTITCGDRVGLLLSIAQIFRRHEIELYSAKIHTLGERVEDRFLIRGRNLDKQRSQLLLEQDLLSNLGLNPNPVK
ncbi:MAG: [protein-PII] uridylyltransferase [Thiobacillaceae bacterium]